jgi:hypothetical protein
VEEYSMEVLGQRRIKGFNDSSQSSIYSNEVHNIKNEELIVKSFKGGPIASGLYSEIKGEVSGAGGKFATSLYAVQITKLNDIVKLELVNLSFTGAALGVFIDAKIKINGTVLELGGKGPEKKKGATKYFEPTIIERGIREDILDKCVMIDEELQKYFDSKSLIPKELEGAAIIVEAVKEIAPESDDLPF